MTNFRLSPPPWRPDMTSSDPADNDTGFEEGSTLSDEFDRDSEELECRIDEFDENDEQCSLHGECYKKNGHKGVCIDHGGLEIEGVSADKAFPTSKGIKLSLESLAGIFIFCPTEKTSYTDFLRMAFRMLLSYNSDDLDPEFIKLIRKALNKYASLDVGFSSPPEEDAFESAVWGAARKERLNTEIKESLAFLPKASKMRLRMVYCDESDHERLKDLIKETTDYPGHTIHKMVSEGKEVSLPYDKAIELYTLLRMEETYLSIKPVLPGKRIAKPATVKLPLQTEELLAFPRWV